MSILTKKQIYNVNYVLNQLSKRILPIYFYAASKEKMNQWQNQICLQSHVIAAYYFDKYFNQNNDFTIHLIEGFFTDSMTGTKYNHSWLWITNNDISSNESYLCDIARVSAHIGFIEASSNHPSKYISDKEIPKERINHNWKKLLQSKEYYTDKPGSEIIKDLDQMLFDSKLSFEDSPILL